MISSQRNQAAVHPTAVRSCRAMTGQMSQPISGADLRIGAFWVRHWPTHGPQFQEGDRSPRRTVVKVSWVLQLFNQATISWVTVIVVSSYSWWFGLLNAQYWSILCNYQNGDEWSLVMVSQVSISWLLYVYLERTYGLQSYFRSTSLAARSKLCGFVFVANPLLKMLFTNWLVVWLPFSIFPLILGCFHHPNWLIFFRTGWLKSPPGPANWWLTTFWWFNVVHDGCRLA